MLRVYLDSSAIVKRYVAELGTDVVALAYSRADLADIKIAFSLWNIGEFIGVLDVYLRRGWIDKEGFDTVLKNFFGEVIRLLRLGVLEIIPIRSSLVAETWALTFKHGIYEADSLQIISCKQWRADVLLTADKRLAEVSNSEGVKARDIEQERELAIKELGS